MTKDLKVTSILGILVPVLVVSATVIGGAFMYQELTPTTTEKVSAAEQTLKQSQPTATTKTQQLAQGQQQGQTTANEKAGEKNTPKVKQPQEVKEEAKKTEKPKHYTYNQLHDPNGIGKFYLGREIAHVMSFHGAPWLERATREQEERLSLLMKALELKEGNVVADIGAGSGVISVLLSKEVGKTGKVMAVDIQEEMLALLKKKATKLGIENIVPVKGTVKDPQLDEASVDLALFVDVYHEFEFPYEMMQAISKSMKPGGRVVLVEYRKEDPRVPIKEVHKMSEKQVRKELEQPTFNLKFKETINVLPRQHIVVFVKNAPGGKTAPEE